ncbi:unnamed protein product [Staurois parvus]|uniref:Uncharacterized protein n=1 Tax=Staurois parvus TaxID=386267 RepID=A0ABN9GUP7_9NEOB|nr:unnamed protein product [Staurois parvus]
MPYIMPTSAHQCHISMPVSAAFQCHLSMQVSVAYQCSSVPPSSALPISVAYQCPSVQPIMPITAASLAHISEGEKSLIYKIL